MKLRRALIPFLLILTALSPLFDMIPGKANAATSRVAVIKSLTGTVQVKKSGGSKQFIAFAKMSLNEGDVLATSANSTAVLQFANGTSEDDKMSVAANTTLTFSKLSDRKGTRTKVSMFNGSAWVDVKSIASQNDEFILETPTAVMGVRGTHFLLSVDRVSGSTRLTVAAGVVSTQTTSNDNPENRDVFPTQNALIFQDVQGGHEISIAPVDLELLMQQSDKSITEAIVKAAGEIVKENNRKIDQYLEQFGSKNAEDQARQKANINNLLGAIVDKAVRSGLITQDRVNQLVAEVQAQAGVTIDLSKKTLTLTDEESQLQKEQRQKDKEARKAAEEQQKKAEEQRDKELQQKLEQDRIKKEEENRKALEEKNKKAQEEYVKQLSDADRQRFKDDKAKLEQSTSPSPSGSTGNTGGGSSPTPTPFDNPLSSLTLYYYVDGSETPVTDTVTVGMSSLSYVLEHPVTSVQLHPVANTTGSLVKVIYDGMPANLFDGKFNVLLAKRDTVVSIHVKSPTNGEIRTVTLNINRPVLPGELGWTTSGGLVWTSFLPEHFVAHANNIDQFTITSNQEYSATLTCRTTDKPCGSISKSGDVTSVNGLSADSTYAYFLEIVTSENDYYQFELVVVNGNPDTHNWDADAAPFDLKLSNGTSVSYDKSSGVYTAKVDADASEVSMLIDLASYDYGIDLGWNDTRWEMLSWDAFESKVRYRLPLAFGDNLFEIYISDDNYLNPHAFKLKITRTTTQVMSGNNNLSTLSLSGGTLSPSFSSSVTNYTMTVPYSIDTVNITATEEDTGKAHVSVTGNTGLSEGDNTVEITVTAENGSAKKYTVTVHRLGLVAPELFATQFEMFDGSRQNNMDQTVANIGGGNYIVHTDATGYMELNIDFPDGYSYGDDLTISGEHLIDAHLTSSGNYWIQYDQNVPVVTLKIQKIDDLGSTILDYNLTINTAGVAMIGMTGLQMNYGTESLSLAPYGPSWFYRNDSLPYEASPIDIVPALINGNSFEVYRNGMKYENGAGIPLQQGWNKVYVVVRPSVLTTGLEGAMVYQVSIYRNAPMPKLTSIQINGGDNLIETGDYSIDLQSETTSITLQFAGNTSPDDWRVHIRKGSESIYSTQSNSPGGNYHLDVIPGLNRIMINTFYSGGGYKEYIIDITVPVATDPPA